MSQYMRDKKISVAIATYNGERYIGALIESILSQTRPPDEIICSDDASSDDTVLILKEFAQTSTIPIHIIERERNVGIVQNFLCGFRSCTGDYIAYCDQDDVWLEDRLLQFQNGILDDTMHLICSPSYICDANLQEIAPIYYDVKRDKCLTSPAVFNAVHAWGHQMLFSRKALSDLLLMYQKSGFEFSEFGSCFDFTIPFSASLSGDLLFQKKPQLKFRRHSASTSEAGHDLVELRGGVRAKAVERMKQAEVHSLILQQALETIDWMVENGHEISPHVREAYQQELDYMNCRLNIFKKRSIPARLLGMLNKDYIGSLRRNGSGRSNLREAAVDAIAVISL